ncbi:MAG: FUSC family protein [Tatlockia sp.]|nr:FUSC family protein [Tatlockia sp.]
MRTAIAALITILIAFFFHFDRPYWSAMTVVILANVYTGSIIDKAILRIIGATLGAVLGYLIAGLVVNSLFLFLISIFLIISFSIYYYNYSPHAYAYLLGALSAFIVIAQLVFMPSQTFYVAIWRPLEIGLGVIISAISAWCILPNSVNDTLLKDAELLFDQTAILFDQLNKLLEAEEPDIQALRANNLLMKKKIRDSVEIFNFARHELGAKKVRIDQFRAIYDQFQHFNRMITYFLSTYNLSNYRSMDSESFKTIAEFFKSARKDLLILKNFYLVPVETPELIVLKPRLANLHQLMISRFDCPDVPLGTVKAYLHLLPLLDQINEMTSNLNNILTNNTRPSILKTKLISNQKQLRNDRDSIVFSIKTALAAILALGIWLISNWPGGVAGIISSIIISVKKNNFEIKHISFFRFLGCLIGGTIALFPLAFFSINLYDFSVILFFSVWAFSYFSFKYSAFSYIGLQANVALIISLAQAGGPPVALRPALERLAGIIIGIVASFIVTNILWRTNLFSLLTRQLQKLFHLLVQNLHQLLQDRQDQGFYDLSNLFWICRSLVESFSMDKFKGLKQRKLIRAKRYFIRMTLIQASISHINLNLDRASAHQVAASYSINLKALENAIIALYDSKTIALHESIKKQIDGILALSDLSIVYLKNPSASLSNCIAYINALNQLKKSFPE